MRRQVGKREQGRCQQHAARKQPPFARHALLKLTLEQGVERVLRLREDGMRMKDAVRQVADDTGLSRNDLYDAALKR